MKTKFNLEQESRWIFRFNIFAPRTGLSKCTKHFKIKYKQIYRDLQLSFDMFRISAFLYQTIYKQKKLPQEKGKMRQRSQKSYESWRSRRWGSTVQLKMEFGGRKAVMHCKILLYRLIRNIISDFFWDQIIYEIEFCIYS